MTTKKLQLAALSVFMLLLNNCGKSISSGTLSGGSRSSSNPSLNANSSSGGSAGLQRECFNVLKNPDNAGLEEFLNTEVTNIEGPVTYCLEINRTGSSPRVKFRIEWEDDQGVRRYPDFYSNSNLNNDRMQLLSIVDNSAATEIILMDIEGFILIEGALNGATNKFEGNLRFVDIVPFQRDSNGQLLTDSNGQFIYSPSPAGPWGECRDSNYLDGGGAHLPGRYMASGAPTPCVTAFNIPHSLFGFDFNYTPSNAFTPYALTSAGFTNIQRANLIGMARQYLDSANQAALKTLNVYQAVLGDLENNPL